ncbi:unnamed protein product, partial [Rotaria sp. Silwood2]
MNDIEDGYVENLFCIVGHPNISKYIDVTDPVFNDKSAKEFLNEIAQCERSSLSSTNKYTSSRIYHSEHISDSGMTSSDDGDTNESNNASDDFHLYRFHNVLLEQKEKVLLSVFDIEVPYKDLYQCKINGTKRSDELMATPE